MEHEPSQYCECKECLIIFQSFHNWRKLKQLETDIKNKAIARKAGSATTTATHLVTHALGIGVVGKIIDYGAGAAVKAATENALQNDTFKQKQKLYRQKKSGKTKENEKKSFPHFKPQLDEKELTDYKNSVLSEKAMRNRIHKFDNDAVIMSLNTNIFGGWVEKKSENLGKWRKRFIYILVKKHYQNGPTCLIQTYKDSLKMDSLDDMRALWKGIKDEKYSRYRTTLIEIAGVKSPSCKVVAIKLDDLHGLTITFNGAAPLVIRSKSKGAVGFWRELFTEIYLLTHRYNGFERCRRFSKLKKNQSDDYMWRILAKYFSESGDYGETIRCYELAHDACPKDAENLIYFIEDLRNYFGDKSNDKQLQLYQKMEGLYSYKYIDYKYYCLLLYKMKKYENLKAILLNNANIGIDIQLLYWNMIYENKNENDNQTSHEYMKFTELIKCKLKANEKNMNNWSIQQLNNYAKLLMNCGDHNEANNYLCLSINKKGDDLVTINLINKNNQYLYQIKNEERDEIKELKQSFQKLESKVEKLHSHSKRLELNIENLTKENDALKNNIKILNEIVPKLQKLLDKDS